MNIRLYKKEDYNMISNWWIAANEPPPPSEMLTDDSTFILEIDNQPMISVMLLLTNTKLAWVTSFVKNPEFKNSKEASKAIVEYAENFAKEKGYTTTLMFAYTEKLKKRYQDLGYINSANNISSFVKRIKE